MNIDGESSQVEASIIDTADELQAWIGMRSIVVSPKDSAVILYTNGASVLEFAMFAGEFYYIICSRYCLFLFYIDIEHDEYELESNYMICVCYSCVRTTKLTMNLISNTDDISLA